MYFNSLKSLYFLSEKIFYPVTLRGIKMITSASSKSNNLGDLPST
jgi:hypothetical protein